MVSMEIFAAPAVKYPESSYFVHSVKLNQYESWPGILEVSKSALLLRRQKPEAICRSNSHSYGGVTKENRLGNI